MPGRSSSGRPAPRGGLPGRLPPYDHGALIRTGTIPVLVIKNAPQGAYRKVVVGTDFSVHARRATELTLRLLPEAEFHLVHAFLVPFEGFMYGAQSRQEAEQSHRQQMARMIKEEMRAFLASLERRPRRLHQAVRKGSAQSVILAEVVGHDADLLVLGTHGRTGVAHAFLGSVAEDLLAQAPCDVLITRAW